MTRSLSTAAVVHAVGRGTLLIEEEEDFQSTLTRPSTLKNEGKTVDLLLKNEDLITFEAPATRNVFGTAMPSLSANC